MRYCKNGDLLLLLPILIASLLASPTTAQRAVSVESADRLNVVRVDGSIKKAAFTVVNSGSRSEVFGVSCISSLAVTACRVAEPIIRLAAGGRTTVTATYVTGGAGDGTVNLAVTSFDGLIESGATHEVVAATPPSVSVGPDGLTAERKTANGIGFRETFTIKNTGHRKHTFQLSCNATGAVTCRGVDVRTVSIEAGATVNVTVRYSTSGAGIGTLTLTATSDEDGSVQDLGAYNVRVGAR